VRLIREKAIVEGKAIAVAGKDTVRTQLQDRAGINLDRDTRREPLTIAESIG
jgi:hypothetical protein